MNLRRTLAEAALLVTLAVLCASVSNLLAGRERKLAVPGAYRDATTPPVRPAPPPVPVVPSEPARGPDGSPPAAAQQHAALTQSAPPSPAAGEGKAAATGRPAAAPAPAAARPAEPVPVRTVSVGSPSPAELLARFPPHHKPFVEVSGEDALWLRTRGALFLDARRTKVYEAGHVAGALSFPVWESDIGDRVTALVGEGRDGQLPVLIYCAGGECEDSHLLAEKLFGAGFENLLVYRDGWPDWLRRGGATAVGGQP